MPPRLWLRTVLIADCPFRLGDDIPDCESASPQSSENEVRRRESNTFLDPVHVLSSQHGGVLTRITDLQECSLVTY